MDRVLSSSLRHGDHEIYPLNEACKTHDIAFSQSKTFRTVTVQSQYKLVVAC